MVGVVGSSPIAPTNFEPSRVFEVLAFLVGVPMALLLSLGMQPNLIGCRYRTKRLELRVFTPGSAWLDTLVVSVMTSFAVLGSIGVLGNDFLGNHRQSLYTVSGKSVQSRGRFGTCFELDLYENRDPLHRLSYCALPAFQEQIALESVMRVTEIRSWFGEQILSDQPVQR